MGNGNGTPMDTPLTRDVLEFVRDGRVTFDGLRQVEAVLRSLANDAMHEAFWHLADAPTTPLMLLAELLEYMAHGPLHRFRDLVYQYVFERRGPMVFVTTYMRLAQEGIRVYPDSDQSVEALRAASDYWGPWQRVLRAVMGAGARDLTRREAARIAEGDAAEAPAADIQPLLDKVSLWRQTVQHFMCVLDAVVFRGGSSSSGALRAQVNDAFVSDVVHLYAGALPADVGTGGLAVLQGLELQHLCKLTGDDRIFRMLSAPCRDFLKAPENQGVHARSVFLASLLVKSSRSLAKPHSDLKVLAFRCASYFSTKLEFKCVRVLRAPDGAVRPWGMLLDSDYVWPVLLQDLIVFRKLCQAAHASDAVADAFWATDLASTVWRLLAQEFNNKLLVRAVVDDMLCSAAFLTGFAPEFQGLLDNVHKCLQDLPIEDETLQRFAALQEQLSVLRRWSVSRQMWVGAVGRVGAFFNGHRAPFGAVVADDGVDDGAERPPRPPVLRRAPFDAVVADDGAERWE